MREISFLLLTCLILVGVCASTHAQSTILAQPPASSSSSTPNRPSSKLEQRLQAISSSLDEANQQLEQSRKEIQQLRQELSQIKGQLAATKPISEQSIHEDEVDTARTTASAIEDLQERQQTLEEQVKLHEQTKVESDSK